MQERLVQLMQAKQLNAAKLADLLGIQRSGLSHILSGRNKPGYDFMEKLLLKFPDLNAEWLILGKGNMLKLSVNPIQDIFSANNEVNNAANVVNSEEAPVYNTIQKPSKPVNLDKVTDVNLLKNVENKQIERIVLFYSDKSFSEYSPEK
ncbi:MAG TPA: helix-turn-helix transcriptional regulator [Bacteroidales bacterium]|nr:helix-turn-helix transcriptional regulator [Bacteroidales bacterium]